MYHQPSKNRQIMMRVLVYGAMSLGVVLLVILLVYYMLGYRFVSGQGVIKQSGLVQYDSTPSGATIEVDGTTLSAKTPAKSSVLPGKHEFVIWREGYETWRKSLSIESGTLTWLNYARLVPKQRPVESVATLAKASDSLASPGGEFMAVLLESDKPAIELFNLKNEKVTQEMIELDTKEYSTVGDKKVKHSFKLVEWDQSGRYLLLQHNFGKSLEWLVVDTEDGKQSLENNLTKTMDIEASEVHFSGASGNKFFVLSGGDIRKVNLLDGTLSRPLARQVADISMYGEDYVGFVTTYDKKTKQRSVGFVRSEGDSPVVVATSDAQPKVPIHIRLTHYFGKDFIIFSEGKTVTILGGDFPRSTKTVDSQMSLFDSFLASSSVQWLLVSGNGRFVVAQHGAEFVSYDLERQIASRVAKLAGKGQAHELDWLDDYYVWSDRSGQLTMREYDGANQHTINQVAIGFDAALSPNGYYLYSIGKTDNGFQLQRVSMILD